MNNYVHLAGHLVNNNGQLTETCKTLDQLGGYVHNDEVYIPVDYFNQLANFSDNIVVVSRIHENGLLLFTTKFEHTYFPPEDPKLNKQFLLGVFRWELENNYPYIIFSFPKKYLDKAIEMAMVLSLGFVNNKIAITTISKDGEKQEVDFPIKGDNVVVLTSLPTNKGFRSMGDLQVSIQGYSQYLNKLFEEEKNQTLEFMRLYYEKNDGTKT